MLGPGTSGDAVPERGARLFKRICINLSQAESPLQLWNLPRSIDADELVRRQTEEPAQPRRDRRALDVRGDPNVCILDSHPDFWFPFLHIQEVIHGVQGLLHHTRLAISDAGQSSLAKL